MRFAIPILISNIPIAILESAFISLLKSVSNPIRVARNTTRYRRVYGSCVTEDKALILLVQLEDPGIEVGVAGKPKREGNLFSSWDDWARTLVSQALWYYSALVVFQIRLVHWIS